MKNLLALSLALALLCAPALSLADPVTLSGSGTDILSGVAVPQVPARITVTGTVKLTLSGGAYDHTYNLAADALDVGVLTEAATFDALVEGDGDWSVSIDPLKDGGTLACEGTGPYVSDFFPLDAPAILTVSFDPSGMSAMLTNAMLSCNYKSSFGLWLSDNLTNELLSGSKKFSADVIVKPNKDGSNYYWQLTVKPGVAWSIKPKE